MNQNKFKELRNINIQKINELQIKIDLIKSEIETLKDNRLKEIMQNITLSELIKYWNSSPFNDRYDIIELNQYIDQRLNKLADYGGLTYNEILDDLLRADWDESQWVDLTEYFSEYCSKKCKCNRNLDDFDDCELCGYNSEFCKCSKRE